MLFTMQSHRIASLEFRLRSRCLCSFPVFTRAIQGLDPLKLQACQHTGSIPCCRFVLFNPAVVMVYSQAAFVR